MYTPLIGMEVHIQPRTDSKMFCSCKNESLTDDPNTNICEICTGQPGALPVPNKKAILFTVKLGTALGCTIRELSKFDRKHYFYPDLPKGYQISQYDEPIAETGSFTIPLQLEDTNRDEATIGITRVHLEEDTAKLFHDKSGTTLVDFNRSGAPLIELVTDPDFQSAREAKIFCQELRTLLRHLDISDADMEKGQMRCEANISMQTPDTFDVVNGVVHAHKGVTLNSKVEIKNLNSFKAVEKAILFEIKRQTELLENGQQYPQETRGWDEDKNETVSQRIKESAKDYRYFPEPDIPPFKPKKIAEPLTLPELPIAKRNRFRIEYGFSYADAKLLTSTTHWANFTEAVMSELISWLFALPEIKGSTDEIKEQKRNKIARLAGGFLTSTLIGALAERKIDIRILKISPENIAELLALRYTERLNATNTQKLLNDMLDHGGNTDPTHIMEEKGYGQISDETKLGAAVDEIIKKFPDQVAQYESGKLPILKFLIGMVMKATEGSADPAVVKKLFLEKLKTK